MLAYQCSLQFSRQKLVLLLCLYVLAILMFPGRLAINRFIF